MQLVRFFGHPSDVQGSLVCCPQVVSLPKLYAKLFASNVRGGYHGYGKQGKAPEISALTLDEPSTVRYNENMNYKTLETSLSLGMNLDHADLPNRKDAETLYATHRSIQGFSFAPGQLVSSEVEKLKKGDGVALLMLALAPAEVSGVNVCPHSTAGCRQHCVAYSGNGKYPAVARARIARTTFLTEHPAAFLMLFCLKLDRESAKAPLAVRLNGFSDIRWERVLPAWFWQRYAHVTFYDYTKHTTRSRPPATLPANYTLTYSVTERSTPTVIRREMAAGRNIAMVVETKGGILRTTGELRPLPSTSLAVVDGDKNDRRFDDPAGVVVMLRRKGSLPVDNPLVVSNTRLARLASRDGVVVV